MLYRAFFPLPFCTQDVAAWLPIPQLKDEVLFEMVGHDLIARTNLKKAIAIHYCFLKNLYLFLQNYMSISLSA